MKETKELVLATDETGKAIIDYLSKVLRLPEHMTRLSITIEQGQPMKIDAQFLAEKRSGQFPPMRNPPAPRGEL